MRNLKRLKNRKYHCCREACRGSD